MKYDDLLSVPYKANGRDIDGMDCYGVTLECCHRCGLDLHDAVYASDKVDIGELEGYIKHLNVIEIDSPKEHSIIQCDYDGHLHIGFMLDKNNCIHATYEGVRITPIIALRNKKYFEVIK